MEYILSFSKPSTVEPENNIILLRLYTEIDRMIDTNLEACIYRYRYGDRNINR